MELIVMQKQFKDDQVLTMVIPSDRIETLLKDDFAIVGRLQIKPQAIVAMDGEPLEVPYETIAEARKALGKKGKG